ncbi:MAG: DUF983 domain-containing protein [Planctomycetaceae bacterium]|nr:DUF983 domain-containing protein [Planctomycetaceae bacterium]
MRQRRIPASVILGRALRLRCPRCGDGHLYEGLAKMYERCSSCQLKYERAPGYFLGSTYINYALTALVITVLFIVLRFKVEVARETLLWPMLALCLLLPVLLFRHARSLWLAMDSYFDAEGFRSDPDGTVPPGQPAGLGVLTESGAHPLPDTHSGEHGHQA